jgi:hydroxypyruvate reductase
VDAQRLLARSLDAHPLPSGETINVVAAGKAARPMARALTTRRELTVGEILIANGSHPVPDLRSVESGLAALKLAELTCARGGLLVVLLSGGASAMLAAPARGISLDDKIEATRLLLRSGLAIAGMNAVRKHLSAIKGGRLAAAAGRSVTFAISDVHSPVEDDPAVIGSGPTVGDDSMFASACDALRGAGILDAMPASVIAHLDEGRAGRQAESIKPGDPRLREARYVLAGSRRDAMLAVAERAKGLGYHTLTIDQPTLGEARYAAGEFVERARALSLHHQRPLCVIASGETTVRVAGHGKGGRNQEFALAAATDLPALGTAALASVGTDGIDGPTNAAGAIADSVTIARARERHLDAGTALRENDAYPLFAALGDLVVTGPTETNVGDVQILLIE